MTASHRKFASSFYPIYSYWHNRRLKIMLRRTKSPPKCNRELFQPQGCRFSKAFAHIEQQPNIYEVVHVKYFEEVSPSACVVAIFKEICIILYSKLLCYCSI